MTSQQSRLCESVVPLSLLHPYGLEPGKRHDESSVYVDCDHWLRGRFRMFTRASVVGAVLFCTFDAASAYVGSVSPVGARLQSRAMSRIAVPSTLREARATRRSATSVSMSDTDFKDWKATTAFLFPGQGAQYLGMAGELVKDVPKAKLMFEQASEVLGYDLLKFCLEGPKEKLDSTVISQPAIYVASLAAVEKFRLEAGQEAIDKATVAAGLSLGEYTALSFAGALSFEDGLKIVKVPPNSSNPNHTSLAIHPGGNPGANLKSISRRCYLFEVAFVWELTKENIVLPPVCLRGGTLVPTPTLSTPGVRIPGRMPGACVLHPVFPRRSRYQTSECPTTSELPTE